MGLEGFNYASRWPNKIKSNESTINTLIIRFFLIYIKQEPAIYTFTLF